MAPVDAEEATLNLFTKWDQILIQLRDCFLSIAHLKVFFFFFPPTASGVTVLHRLPLAWLSHTKHARTPEAYTPLPRASNPPCGCDPAALFLFIYSDEHNGYIIQLKIIAAKFQNYF